MVQTNRTVWSCSSPSKSCGGFGTAGSGLVPRPDGLLDHQRSGPL